jgi:predicted RNA binding protein YcfA (HicA-like mRNA interferase family)
MSRYDKLLFKILSGRSDANISFDDVCNLLEKFGFQERIRGDHHIFTRDNVEEILNLQPKGSKAKPYQVKQVRDLIVRYKLSLEKSDDK